MKETSFDDDDGDDDGDDEDEDDDEVLICAHRVRHSTQIS